MNEPNKTPLPLRVQTVRWDGRLWWTTNVDHQCEQLYLIERETRSAAMVTGGSLEIKGMHYGTWAPMAKVEGYIPDLEHPKARPQVVPSCLCGAEWVAQNAVGACRCGPCLVKEDEASVGNRVEWRNFKTDPAGVSR